MITPKVIIQDGAETIGPFTDFRQALAYDNRKNKNNENNAQKTFFYVENVDNLLEYLFWDPEVDFTKELDSNKLVLEETVYLKVKKSLLANNFMARYLQLIQSSKINDIQEEQLPLPIDHLELAEKTKKVQEQLIKTKWIQKTDKRGDFLYSSDYLKLERALISLYKQVVGINYDEIRLPHFFNLDTLSKENYLKTVGDFLYFGNSLKCRGENLQIKNYRLKSFLEGDIRADHLKEYLTHPVFVLNYSSCNTLWPSINGARYKKGLRLLDHSTTSYRCEGIAATKSLERTEVIKRLEAIFIDSKDKVLAECEALKEKLLTFLKLLKIPVEILKTKPWTGAIAGKELTTLDFMTYTDKWLELGNLSFNDQIYTKPFNVKCNNDKTYSGCSGFGLQRLIYAFLINNSFVKANWPERIQQLFF